MNSKTISESGDNWVRFGDGLLIQWYSFTTPSSGSSTLTFNKPYANNNYKIAACRDNISAYEWTPCFTNKTVTGVNLAVSDRSNVHHSASIDVIIIGKS